MLKLYRWYIDEPMTWKGERFACAHGNVMGHSKFATGTHITTSSVEEVTVSEEEEMVIIRTLNSTYYCPWKDCDFSKTSTANYVRDFDKYAEKYGEEWAAKKYELENNSILLVFSDQINLLFENAIMQRDEKKSVLNVAEYNNSVYFNIAKGGEAKGDDSIDIRYTFRNYNKKQLYFYLVKMPENMKLYVENTGKNTLEFVLPHGSISVEAGERVLVCEGKTVIGDFRKIIKNYWEAGEQFPGLGSGFERKAVQGRLQDFLSCIRKEEDLLWIIKANESVDRGLYKGSTSKYERIIVANPVSMAFAIGEYELAKKLAEAGYAWKDAGDVPCSIEWMEAKEWERWPETHMVISPLEILCMDEEMPETVYQFFWKQITAQELLQRKKHSFMGFSFFGKEKAEKVLLFQRRICKLREINGDAAAIFLQLMTRYYIYSLRRDKSEHIWKMIFEAFECADDRNVILKEPMHILEEYYSCDIPVSMFDTQWREMLKAYRDFETPLAFQKRVIGILYEILCNPRYDSSPVKYNLFLELVKLVEEYQELDMEEWDDCVYELLRDGEENVIRMCMNINFIPKSRRGDFATRLITEKEEMRSPMILPLLIKQSYDTDLCGGGGHDV